MDAEARHFRGRSSTPVGDVEAAGASCLPRRIACNRLVRVALCLSLLLALAPHSFAWGPEGHRWIHARAFERLPPDLAAYWKDDGPYLIEHSSDPDIWRQTNFEEENPRHFIDIDRYGSFPFPDL